MKKHRKQVYWIISILLLVVVVGCSKTVEQPENTPVIETTIAPQDTPESVIETEKPYSYYHELSMIDDKYRNYYEVFVYSFCDSNGDGIGDIQGLISKLDYINDGDDSTDTDLGYTGIWLMPICPSTTYHKYDVTDYYSIDPQYGTMEDFIQLVKECDKRGIRLITDFVMNHTSSKHPWFVAATEYLESLPEGVEPSLEECPYVGYYNFIDEKSTKGVYEQVGNTKWYYECEFWKEMPDLNLDNEQVRKEFEQIAAYWLDLGVKGFRLDAAKEYFSGRSSKNVEVLTWFVDYVESKDPDAYVVAEVWESLNKYAEYYQSGIDSLFNFDFSQNEGWITKTILSPIEKYSGKAFGEAMVKHQEKITSVNPNAIDAPFYVNHDNARAAGYFAYDMEQTKMAAGMNLMMSGCSFTYYGEEIGMTGSGKDENKRAPMFWTTGTEGMTKGPLDMEKQENHFGSVEEQQKDPLSIYNYNKRALRIRNENPEIARGVVAIIPEVEDVDVCAITKTYQDSQIILLYNISQEEKKVTLSKQDYPYEGIRGYLTATGEEVLLEGETITLPRYSIVVLK